MRTTLTLDDDVAARLDDAVRKRKQPMKVVVNEALRAGLEALDAARPRKRKPFRTRGFDLGPSLIGSLDNIEEVLVRAEGEDHK
jgi:ribbon-helix-helix CopG family protein